MTEKLLRSDFYYELPEGLIAQDPLEKRDNSRLLVLDRATGKIRHDSFFNIGSYLTPDDLLVLNDTKVIPARLLGVKEDTGASVEVLLLKHSSETRSEAEGAGTQGKKADRNVWECLVRPGKKLRPGAKISFGDGKLRAEIMDVLPDGNRLVHFTYDGIWEEVLDSLGEMPLPPYIKHKLKDKDRYQTVYARFEGSAAAPTAGLHFTEELLNDIESKGTGIAYVTLHVGLGTFRPVKEDNILDHHMHSEWYSIPKETTDRINAVHSNGKGRVICVGTTSCRTIESAANQRQTPEFDVAQPGETEILNLTDRGDSPNGRHIVPGSGETDIFIYPGYDFKVTDALITNFHLPESTLIMLVSAFGGYDKVMKAYKEAVEQKYRFFSFGDAMFIK